MTQEPLSASDALPIHTFDAEHAVLPAAGDAEVGGKGGNLLRMAGLGLPVPPGFILGTALCRHYHAHQGRLPANFTAALAGALERLEAQTGLRFGSARRPLLLAVRSGAAQSMPGMLETLLNVGLNEVAVSGLVRSTGNPRLAWDSYRRYIHAYAEVVCGCRSRQFDTRIAEALAARGLATESELDTPALRRLAHDFEELFRVVTGERFPQDPMQQLHAAVEAVLRSWQHAHAVAYRDEHGLDHAAGTAVTIQAMVFGNAGATSGAGVGFTRDPATGVRALYLDFAFNAQGEDVVAGRHAAGGGAELAAVLPAVHAEVVAAAACLEDAFRDLQDFEFTVQDGRLFLLQTRVAKRSPLAALTVAVDMVDEGLICPAEAVQRLARLDLDAITVTRFADADGAVLADATPASIGVACGRVAFDPARARAMAAGGEDVILVRNDASTEDFAGMAAAAGLLTALGAKTSHAAVVARELGRVCLVACAGLVVDSDGSGCTLNGQRIAEGDYLALDGNHGHVFMGRRTIISAAPAEIIARVRGWQQRRAEGNG